MNNKNFEPVITTATMAPRINPRRSVLNSDNDMEGISVPEPDSSDSDEVEEEDRYQQVRRDLVRNANVAPRPFKGATETVMRTLRENLDVIVDPALRRTIVQANNPMLEFADLLLAAIGGDNISRDTLIYGMFFYTDRAEDEAGPGGRGIDLRRRDDGYEDDLTPKQRLVKYAEALGEIESFFRKFRFENTMVPFERRLTMRETLREIVSATFAYIRSAVTGFAWRMVDSVKSFFRGIYDSVTGWFDRKLEERYANGTLSRESGRGWVLNALRGTGLSQITYVTKSSLANWMTRTRSYTPGQQRTVPIATRALAQQIIGAGVDGAGYDGMDDEEEDSAVLSPVAREVQRRLEKHPVVARVSEVMAKTLMNRIAANLMQETVDERGTKLRFLEEYALVLAALTERTWAEVEAESASRVSAMNSALHEQIHVPIGAGIGSGVLSYLPSPIGNTASAIIDVGADAMKMISWMGSVTAIFASGAWSLFPSYDKTSMLLNMFLSGMSWDRTDVMLQAAGGLAYVMMPSLSIIGMIVSAFSYLTSWLSVVKPESEDETDEAIIARLGEKDKLKALSSEEAELLQSALKRVLGKRSRASKTLEAIVEEQDLLEQEAEKREQEVLGKQQQGSEEQVAELDEKIGAARARLNRLNERDLERRGIYDDNEPSAEAGEYDTRTLRIETNNVRREIELLMREKDRLTSRVSPVDDDEKAKKSAARKRQDRLNAIYTNIGQARMDSAVLLKPFNMSEQQRARAALDAAKTKLPDSAQSENNDEVNEKLVALLEAYSNEYANREARPETKVAAMLIGPNIDDEKKQEKAITKEKANDLFETLKKTWSEAQMMEEFRAHMVIDPNRIAASRADHSELFYKNFLILGSSFTLAIEERERNIDAVLMNALAARLEVVNTQGMHKSYEERHRALTAEKRAIRDKGREFRAIRDEVLRDFIQSHMQHWMAQFVMEWTQWGENKKNNPFDRKNASKDAKDVDKSPDAPDGIDFPKYYRAALAQKFKLLSLFDREDEGVKPAGKGDSSGGVVNGIFNFFNATTDKAKSVNRLVAEKFGFSSVKEVKPLVEFLVVEEFYGMLTDADKYNYQLDFEHTYLAFLDEALNLQDARARLDKVARQEARVQPYGAAYGLLSKLNTPEKQARVRKLRFSEFTESLIDDPDEAVRQRVMTSLYERVSLMSLNYHAVIFKPQIRGAIQIAADELNSALRSYNPSVRQFDVFLLMFSPQVNTQFAKLVAFTYNSKNVKSARSEMRSVAPYLRGAVQANVHIGGSHTRYEMDENAQFMQGALQYFQDVQYDDRQRMLVYRPGSYAGPVARGRSAGMGSSNSSMVVQLPSLMGEPRRAFVVGTNPAKRRCTAFGQH